MEREGRVSRQSLGGCGPKLRKPGPPGLEETGGVLPESLHRDHGPDNTLSSDLCPQTEQEHVSVGF